MIICCHKKLHIIVNDFTFNPKLLRTLLCINLVRNLMYMHFINQNLEAVVDLTHNITGDPLHSRAACTQPCNVNTHSRAHCSPGARLCEQWGHGCVNNGARLCASARLCRGSPVNMGQLFLCEVCHTRACTVGFTPVWCRVVNVRSRLSQRGVSLNSLRPSDAYMRQ